MNDIQNDNLEQWAELDCDAVDFDALENKLESDLEQQMSELKDLEIEKDKIGSPDSIGETVKNVVWEQFINQIGVVAGEDFIKENRGLTLDLRDEAHIQTAENFANGKIATHNTKIDYQQRHDDWQANFKHDENGNTVTFIDRAGKEQAVLVDGARKPFDKDRPHGSAEKGTDIDHEISAGEIIRDAEANAHLTKEENIAFANSEPNLHEMDAAQNRSKGDLPMNDWLDNPNKNGQKPDEIFDISEEQKNEYREKDAEARAEFAKRKKEGEQRSIETGKQSQKEEALRIGGDALRSVIMSLLASLIKDIIRKLIAWFRSDNKKFSTFIDSIKEAIKSFVSNIKEHLLNAGNSLITTIATAIFGPVIGMIKKAWIFLKQGYKSIKDAIAYLKNPANKNKPFGDKMLQVGKIVIGGLTAGGAIVLGEVIEKGLTAVFPAFAIQIPLLGSLASLIGMFLGAIVSGLIGALALNLIDRLIAKRLKQENAAKQLDKKNSILQIINQLIEVVKNRFFNNKVQVARNIIERHNKEGAYYNEIKEQTEQTHNSVVNNNKKITQLLNS